MSSLEKFIAPNATNPLDQLLTWRKFCDEVAKIGLYDDKEARYLIQERFEILCKNTNQPTGLELKVTLEQLKQHHENKIQNQTQDSANQ